MTSKENDKTPQPNSTKNFLTLVVIFAAAACASVGFALAMTSESLDPMQNWALIGFLLVFPFAGLGVIAWLALYHGTKMLVGNSNRDLPWVVVSPEKQKENLNRSVNQLGSIMKVEKEQLSDLRSAYIVAEDLALRKIQHESQIPISRHVAIGGSDFDGVYVDQDTITCIQVDFIVTPQVRQEKINAILKKTSSAKENLVKAKNASKLRLLLVLVTQLDPEAEAKLRSSLVSKFSATPVDVDIRLLDFLGLQKIYSE
ncbi:MAG: hypothetical protein KDB79_01670 [Acidobacteria bacterium]|nr:hypothetical protein [Acidobacteriota bacterium]